MSIKKKLALGAASAALGLSLIGGGTFAYFNDTATVNNQFAAGTLNLDVLKTADGEINFDLRNMKPGDTAKRYFVLQNSGSLSIKDVMMAVVAKDFKDGMVEAGKTSDSNMEGFLKQFKVEFFRVQNPDPAQPGGPWNNPQNADIIATGKTVTLWDLHSKNYADILDPYKGTGADSGRLNLSPTGLPVGDQDGVGIQITFVDQGNQNIYQGDSVKVSFDLEARQEAGVEVRPNGYIKSNENHPSSPVGTDNSDGKNLEAVTDAKDNPKE